MLQTATSAERNGATVSVYCPLAGQLNWVREHRSLPVPGQPESSFCDSGDMPRSAPALVRSPSYARIMVSPVHVPSEQRAEQPALVNVPGVHVCTGPLTVQPQSRSTPIVAAGHAAVGSA